MQELRLFCLLENVPLPCFLGYTEEGSIENMNVCMSLWVYFLLSIYLFIYIYIYIILHIYIYIFLYIYIYTQGCSQLRNVDYFKPRFVVPVWLVQRPLVPFPLHPRRWDMDLGKDLELAILKG